MQLFMAKKRKVKRSTRNSARASARNVVHVHVGHNIVPRKLSEPLQRTPNKISDADFYSTPYAGHGAAHRMLRSGDLDREHLQLISDALRDQRQFNQRLENQGYDLTRRVRGIEDTHGTQIQNLRDTLAPMREAMRGGVGAGAGAPRTPAQSPQPPPPPSPPPDGGAGAAGVGPPPPTRRSGRNLFNRQPGYNRQPG